jgi:acyl-CoA dehydrogenase
VPWLQAGGRCVLVGADAGGAGAWVVLLAPEPADLEPRRSPAGEPQAGLALEGRRLATGGFAAAPSTVGPERLLALYALARTALMAGALERVLDLTLEHAQGRVQFGKPIGRFQAVQQSVAQLAGESAIVGASIEAAAEVLDQDPDPSRAWFAIASAKARASAAAAPACAIAHQLHAAIGFTREHVLHRFTRRLWAWRDEAGSESYWWGSAGERLLADGADSLWPRICGE